jgi:hypothetical protein
MAINHTKPSPDARYQRLLKLLKTNFPKALEVSPLATLSSGISTKHGLLSDTSRASLIAGAEFALNVMVSMRRRIKKPADVTIHHVRVINSAMRLFEATKVSNDEIYLDMSKKVQQIFPEWSKNYQQLRDTNKSFVASAKLIANAAQSIDDNDLGDNPLSKIAETIEGIVRFKGPSENRKSRVITLASSTWGSLKSICDKTRQATIRKKQFADDYSTVDVHGALFAISEFSTAIDEFKKKTLAGNIPAELLRRFATPTTNACLKARENR